MPLRKDIDPLELKDHLGSLNIIECLPERDDFRYRLIGTRIAEARPKGDQSSLEIVTPRRSPE